MKTFYYSLIIALCASLPMSLFAGLTEEELKPYEKILPKGLTPKEISEWPLEITYKAKTHLKLEIGPYSVKLSAKDKKKMEKKKKVVIRIAGEVTITELKKKAKKSYKGSANVYIYSTGDAPKKIASKSYKLSKLCPS